MRMNLMNTKALAMLGTALLLWVGCGGGGSGYASAGTSTRGAMSVTLVDGPSPDYKAIHLNVQSVQVHHSATAEESGWITVASPNKTIDLLTLQGGVTETLAAQQTLDAGSYQMLRLVLGSGNTLTLADGSTVDLTVPSGMQTGIKIPLNFTVQAGTTADVWIDFDGAHSIHVVGTGSGKYMLRPVVHGFMKTATGSVSGTLTGPGGFPLSGALVMAESVDASGNVTILRTATTNASGAYTLNLLPLGQTFYVVSQPVVAGLSYGAQASGALTLTSSSAVLTANLAFTLALGTGTVSGGVTPVATLAQSDTVVLLQALPTGGAGSTLLAVASLNAVVGVGSETYAFPLVPAGAYAVQGLRTTLNADGTTTLSRSPVSPSFAVAAAATTTQNVAF